MNQTLLIEIVNGFTIGILIGFAWYLQARIITRIFFVMFVFMIALFMIWLARQCVA
jgi:uncharacterized membrane protein (Fun14 family)